MKSILLLALLACTAHAGITRDWSAHPAIVELDDGDDIYAISDPHGGAKELAAILTANHLIKGTTWTGGSAILVVAGDLIDKGPDSLGVIDLLRTLEPAAKAKGGRIIVTIGNHEAELLADPQNKKAAAGIDIELAAAKIDPADLARGSDAKGRGRWLIDLPFGVRIKKWFFAHGGNTAGDSISQLAKKLESGFADHGFADKAITGKDSILEAQEWYGKDRSAKKQADALGVKHIVFGHDPGAFGEHGHILASKDGTLVKIDVNGSLMLHIRTKGNDSAETLDASGAATPLL